MNQTIGPEENNIREFKSRYVLPEQTELPFNAGYRIAATKFPAAFKTTSALPPPTIELSEQEVRQLREVKSDSKFGFEPESVQKLVDAMLKSAAFSKKAQEESNTEQITNIAHFVLNASTREPTPRAQDDYVRPEETNLKVPVTHMSTGQLAVSTKGRLGGKSLGSGAFKTVTSALVMSFDSGQVGNIKIEEAVSASMTTKNDTDRKAIAIEKRMMLRLKELGENDNIIKCFTVTDYEKKETGEQKIGIIMEYCNGGDLKDLIENTYSSDQELEIIGEGILNGVNFLHEKGIFHSDLKPANILLKEDEDGNVTGAKVADFGCARDLNDPTQRTYFTGDREFHSPELKLLDEKMGARVNPQLENEFAAMTATKKTYDILHANYEVSKKTIDLKQEQLDQLTENGLPEEIQKAQTELDEAKEDSAKIKEELTKIVEEHTAKEAVYVNKKESLIEANREELYAIDESYLKSDVFATGMILERLYKKAENRLTPEMKQLIADMLKPENNNRISSKEALERFQRLKNEGKILNKATELAFPVEEIDHETEVVQETGKGSYHLPQDVLLKLIQDVRLKY